MQYIGRAILLVVTALIAAMDVWLASLDAPAVRPSTGRVSGLA